MGKKPRTFSKEIRITVELPAGEVSHDEHLVMTCPHCHQTTTDYFRVFIGDNPNPICVHTGCRMLDAIFPTIASQFGGVAELL